MAKTSMLDRTTPISVRVNSEAKQGAEKVFSELGLSMSSAIDMFLRQVNRDKCVPLNLSIQPSIPDRINIDKMSKNEILAGVQTAYEEYVNGNVVPFTDFVSDFSKKHNL